MDFKRILKTRIIFIARAALLCGIFLCIACGHTHKIKSLFIAEYKVYLKTLEKGNEAFQKGDYNKAQEIYEILYQKSSDKTITREALYGLACTHFILAKNSNDFNKAIVLWNTWNDLASSVMGEEDPRMLGPLLQHRVKKWITDDDTEEILKSEVNKLNLLLQSREKEIHTLKDQIKKLGEIDQKIHEKQHEISFGIE